MSAVNVRLSRELECCLLSILQRGITEARTLALTGEACAAAQLLDALDNIPRHLADWSGDSEQEIRTQLAAFQDGWREHPTNYVGLLDCRVDLLTHS
jgi:hypothetical protein